MRSTLRQGQHRQSHYKLQTLLVDCKTAVRTLNSRSKGRMRYVDYGYSWN